MAVVENSLKFATMELIVDFFCILFALGISIATAVLASRKGRNSVNWFFLSLFWGIVGLIVLACSKHLEREKGESDTLSLRYYGVSCLYRLYYLLFSSTIIQ